ncbi:unnamed protein product [Rotaria sordida]|uniref:SS18 N-terminal domain-containing protein n=1 Tax=Rotaria sordida TaxID=392033 RepID=A0A814CX28_9BILA|nr:unnamed protein product [Rotaria sordida]CAF1081209.1 unnamed protein product [Rotaria sordida]CAF3581914.1 unnamed protein product [Rotaria sordida]CAF3664778.1 unnamed protein product [Rotaria sordida]
MISTMYSQQQMAPMPQQQKPTIQKLLDDNSQLISLILDLQSKGRQMESIEYQRTLHRNLTYLTQFDVTQTHHPNSLPPPDAFIQTQQTMMGNNMMQPNQMGVPTSTPEQMYRAQTNSPAPSNVPSSTLNKSPHGSSSNSAGGLYPPSNTSTTNSSMPPSLQQQRSPAGSIPSPSPSGPITSSISPQNPVMNKAPTPQPTSSHLSSMSQQQQPRPYLPSQPMMQQQQGRVMNGTPMDHSSTGQTQSSYIQGQQSYIPQQQQQQHAYTLQQNGYGHHPNGGMPQQHYSMYHQQQNPGMSVPSNQIAKPNSPLNNQQQSIIQAPSSPKPSSSSSPSQATNTQNLVSNQQQQQMAYNNYAGQQQMYHPQQTYHMQQQQQQQWQNQPPRMMMQPQYTPYQQGQYQQTPPQT